MKITPYLLLLILIGCQAKTPEEITMEESTQQNNTRVAEQDSIIEIFIDSTTIGNKGKNKLTAIAKGNPDSTYILIDFYSKKNNEWVLKNHYEYMISRITGIDPFIADYNNDGFKDFNYSAGIAARGSNNIRRLFVYNPTTDSLMLIKNSTNYPNMVYNETLDCIDVLIFTGSFSQSFLRIEEDTLFEFADIYYNGRNIIVSEFDESGNETVILNDSISAEEFQYGMRYKNYKPLIKYETAPDSIFYFYN